MDDDIPPLRSPQDMPPVRTQADLYRHWRALMGELGFSEQTLWFQFFYADGRCAPIIQHVTEIPEIPDGQLMTNLLWVCQKVMDDCTPGGSVAFLLSRPGNPALTSPPRTERGRRAWPAQHRRLGSSAIPCTWRTTTSCARSRRTTRSRADAPPAYFSERP